MPLNTIVSDEQPIVRDGLCAALDGDPGITVAESTGSGSTVLSRVGAGAVDVVVTGLRLQEMTGIELARRLRECSPAPGTVLFAVGDEDDVVAEALHVGVGGLLTSDAGKDEIRAAIYATARGGSALDPKIAKRLVGWFRQSDVRPEAPLRSALESLTPREREILVLTARGLSALDIGRSLVIEVATVRTHLYRLQTKLAANDRAQLVSLAYRGGVMRSTTL